MPLTTVVNVRRQRCDVFIGRPSKWGNPFKIGKDDGGTVWSRDDVIKLYESWIRNNESELMKAARVELRGKVLGCFCAPLPCHGDVLARIAEEDA